MGEIIRPTSTTDVGSVSNPTYVYDGNLSSKADISCNSSGPSDADSSSCIANFPSYSSGSSSGFILRTKHSGATSATGDDVVGGSASAQIQILYSINGGSNYTLITNMVSAGSRNMTDVDTLPEEIKEILLVGSQDISQVKVKYIVFTTATDGDASADIDAFEAWIEVLDGAGGVSFIG